MEEETRAGWPWWPVVAVVAVGLSCGYATTLPVATLAEVARRFGSPASSANLAEQAGLAGSVLGLGLATLRLAAIGGMPVAALADRLGRRSVMVRAATFGFAATALAAFAPSFWTLVLAFALARPLLAAAMAVAQIAVVELAPGQGRSGGAGALAAGYGIGGGLAALVNNLVPVSLGYRFAYLLALVPMVALYLGRHRIPEPTHYLAAISDERPRLRSLGPVLRPRAVRVAGLAFLVAFAAGPANSFLFVYAKNVADVPRGTVAIMVGCSAITGIGGLFIGRRIADHLGRKPALTIGVVAIVSAALVVYSGSKLAVVVGYLLGVGAGGLISPAATPFINELFPTRARGAVAGVNVVAGVCGGVSGLLWFGWMVNGGSYATAAWLTFPVALATLLILRRLPETRGGSLEEVPA